MIDRKDSTQQNEPGIDRDINSTLYKSAARKAIQHHRRVAGKGDERGSFTAEEWLRLCEQYDNKCALCGYERPLTPDHVVPVYMGGPNTIDNIQPLCKACNMAKYRTAADYRPGGVLLPELLQQNDPVVHEPAPAPRPIWREQLVEMEQQLRDIGLTGLGEKAEIPGLSGTDLETWHKQAILALVEEIRRLRQMVLENETLASVESVAWWSRGTLPASFGVYLSTRGRRGEAS